MAMKLYNDTDVAAIADAIREKNGSSDKYTVSQMADAITALQAQEEMPPTELQDYVRAEALEVAQKVKAVQTDKTITFLAMADNHYYGEQGNSDTYVDSDGTQGNVSNLHSAMAAKALAYVLDFDFVAHMGDFTWGSKTTNSDLLHSQVQKMAGLLNEAYGDLPKFFCVGNHDSGIYYHNAQIAAGKTGTFTESADWIYNNFTKYSESDDTVIAGKDCGGYCYRDFPDKKLRVFMLNTSQALIEESADNATYGSQRIWFGNALLNLNSKSDAAQWSWMLLCHYPADYGGTMPLSELIKAYVEGSSISITDEKTSTATTLNFSGKNGAKLIAQFHGHVHNFLTSKLYSYATGSGKQYDAWRVGIPNGQYNRENYYTTVGSRTDISFAEPKSYPKTPNTGEDTSFVVNVIDPEKQVIHSFCYGAGYDRTIGYASTVYYSIASTLTQCTISNTATSIQEGEPYSATLTPNDKYSLTSVKVTMGGTDVTGSVYSSGVITIPNVTGNIVITATATKIVSYTNLVPTSIDTSGAIYNGTGYKNGYCLNSSGGESGDMGKFTVTGFIPYSSTKNKALRVGGSAQVNNYTDYGWRCSVYNSSFTHLLTIAFSGFAGHVSVSDGVLLVDDLTQFNGFNSSDAKYIRVSCATGTSAATVNGAGLVVTLDQEID